MKSGWRRVARSRIARAIAVSVAFAAGCSSSNNNANQNGTVIGPSGGTVTSPDGASLQIPAGAVPASTTFTVGKSSAQAPTGAVTPVFNFGPEGTTFSTPVTVSFAVPAGTTSASIYWTTAGSGSAFDTLPTTISGTTATAQVTHFSSGFVGAPCTTNAACTPASVCHQGSRKCNGTPTCMDTGVNASDGAACGAENVCSAGVCGARCAAGVACTPSGTADACKVYATTCNAQLTQTTCSPTANQPDGTACGTGDVCSAGACIAACVPNQGCTPSNADPCKTYATACNADLTQTTCSTAGNQPDGTACGAANVCYAGSCASVRTVSGRLETVFVAADGTRTTAGGWPLEMGGATVTALLVPGASGYAEFPVNVDASGSFSVSNVPAGIYFIQVDQPSTRNAVAVVDRTLYEAAADAPDLSVVLTRRSDVAYATGSTPVTLNWSGLAPFDTTDRFRAYGSQPGMAATIIRRGQITPKPSIGSTSISGSVDWSQIASAFDGLPDASKGDVVWLAQRKVRVLTFADGLQADASNPVAFAKLTDLTIADGSGGTMNAVLAPIAQTGAITSKFALSQFAALASQVNPRARPDDWSGVGAGPSNIAFPYTAAYPDAPIRGGAGTGAYINFHDVWSDVDPGTQQYGQFLDAQWIEVGQYLYQWNVPLTAPGGAPTYMATEIYADEGLPVGQAPATVAPVLGPPLAPAIDGNDAFTPRADTGAQPTITWSPTALGAPTQYMVRVYATDAPAANQIDSITAVLFDRAAFQVPAGVLRSGAWYAGTIIAVQSANTLDGPIIRTGGHAVYVGCDFGLFTPGHAGPEVSAVPANGSATLSWTAAPGASGYAVTTSPGSTISVAAPPATIPGLANGTAYSFTVASVDAAGQSTPSAAACAVPTASDTSGLTLYDPLCGTSLDGSRWQNPQWSAKVDSAAATLEASADHMLARSIRNDNYGAQLTVNAAGHRVTTLAADITVPAGPPIPAGVWQLATVRLSYQPPATRLSFPGGLLGYINVEVGLINTADGLYAVRRFVHCDDASCSTATGTGVAAVDPPAFIQITGSTAGLRASFNTTYTASISLNETTGIFSWSLSGGTFGATGYTGTGDFTTYLDGAGEWAGVPLAGAFNNAGLFVRQYDESAAGGGEGDMKALFGNAWAGFDDKSPALFDDFSGTNGNSGPLELSLARWSAGPAPAVPGGSAAGSQLLSGSGLVIHSQVTADAANAATDVHVVDLSDPASANTVQADLAMSAAFGGATGGDVRAFVQGRFYNTGETGTTPPDVNEPYSGLGDVIAQAWLQANGNAAHWNILRCDNASCSASTSVGGGLISGVAVGTAVHAVRVQWDPLAPAFTFSVDGHAVTVDPTTAGSGITTPAPFIKTANAPFRRILTNVSAPAGAGNTTVADVTVNNVFVTP